MRINLSALWASVALPSGPPGLAAGLSSYGPPGLGTQKHSEPPGNSCALNLIKTCSRGLQKRLVQTCGLQRWRGHLGRQCDRFTLQKFLEFLFRTEKIPD